MKRIRTYLLHRPDRNIEVQWEDPTTGRLRTRSTGTKKEREAIAFQLNLETKLNDDEGEGTDVTTFALAADRYESEVLSSRAEKTQNKWKATRHHVEQIIDPQFVSALKSKKIGQLANALRAKHLAALTVKGYLSYLRTFLKWCKKEWMIREVPNFEMPRRVNKMKGRPITQEEFDRMIAALPDVFQPVLIPTWTFFLRGLWLSGLRLGEALKLTWDRSDFCVNLESGIVRIKIEANAQKSTKAQLLPVAPDFSDFLLTEVPPKARRGRVFKVSLYEDGREIRLDTCSNKIQDIGQAAGVKVEEKPAKPSMTKKPGKSKPEGPRIKYASAHDFRRAFGKRWRKKVKSDVLKALMRHASITTTEQFYDDETAEEVEAAIQASLTPFPNIFPNTAPVEPTALPQKT